MVPTKIAKFLPLQTTSKGVSITDVKLLMCGKNKSIIITTYMYVTEIPLQKEEKFSSFWWRANLHIFSP